jgi:hypothetical protein
MICGTTAYPGVKAGSGQQHAGESRMERTGSAEVRGSSTSPVGMEGTSLDSDGGIFIMTLVSR